jgi:hypothetical protein
MNANNEEYLDSLLNSAKSSDNPQSALSRMATKGGKNSSTSQRKSGAGDIGALVDNSNGENEALNDIGSLLDRLDRDEIIDDRLSSMLDDIQKPTDSGIPTFTVGATPTVDDVRDPEEIALDEAIADAERMDQEAQSGKFSDSSDDEQGQP